MNDLIFILTKMFQRKWYCMDEHKREWYCMDEHKREWYCIDEHKREWYCMDEHVREWYCMDEHKREWYCIDVSVAEEIGSPLVLQDSLRGLEAIRADERVVLLQQDLTRLMRTILHRVS